MSSNNPATNLYQKIQFDYDHFQNPSQSRFNHLSLINGGTQVRGEVNTFVTECEGGQKISKILVTSLIDDHLPLSVPTINLVGIVGSNSRQDAPCAC